jgi:hypothetical protein
MSFPFEMKDALVAEGLHLCQSELERLRQKITGQARERGCGGSSEEDGRQREVDFIEEVGGGEGAQEGSTPFADEGFHPILGA